MSKRARVLGWAVIAAFPIVVLLSLEGVIRVLGVSPRFERDAALPPWLDRNILVKDSRWVELLSSSPRELRNYYGTYEWDRFLFYRLRPNLSVPLTDVLAPPGHRERTRWILTTNGKGYRGREAAFGSHAGVYRILCAGDSSTFGWGVESEDAYPSLLEAELRSRRPGVRIEVVNLGVCGYSSFQGRILLEREGLKYEPDLVTISYGSNDWSAVPEPFDEAYRRNAGWTGAVREVLHRSRAYQIWSAFLTRALLGREKEAVAKLSEDSPEMILNVGPEKSKENLLAMVAATRGSGADAILVTNCVPGEMSDPIREAARESTVPLLDTESVLRGLEKEVSEGRLYPDARARVTAIYGEAMLREYPDLEIYLADRCHPNVVGQRLLARALADLVERTASFRRIAGTQ